MELGDYLASSRHRDYPSIILLIVKYFLLIAMFLSSLYVIIFICSFVFNQDAWTSKLKHELELSNTLFISDPFDPTSEPLTTETPEPEPRIPSNYINKLITQEIDMFLVKSALGLVYFAVGFIALISEDYYISLFFSFTSLVGFLCSLVRRENELQIVLMIYTITISLFSLIHCALLKLTAREKSYYYGYLQS